MKWSEDGSEVTLTAAEFAAQNAAIAASNTKRLEADAHARTCNDLLNETIKKDMTIRRAVDLKACCDRQAVAQAETISAAKEFFAKMMNAFFGLQHPKECPCHVCDSTRSTLEARAKKVFNGDSPQFEPKE